MSGRRISAFGAFAEAAILLVLARLLLGVLPFRMLVPLFERRASGPEVLGEGREIEVRRVQQAITRATRRLPGETVCFPRAIAAQMMLRRRGITTMLHYGVSSVGGLTAHVWLQDGDRGVVGLRAAAGYHALTRYPAEQP